MRAFYKFKVYYPSELKFREFLGVTTFADDTRSVIPIVYDTQDPTLSMPNEGDIIFKRSPRAYAIQATVTDLFLALMPLLIGFIVAFRIGQTSARKRDSSGN